MYDNVKIINNNNTSIGFINTIPHRLTKIITEGESLTGHFVSGYLDNLKIVVTNDKIKITQGSICKFYLGDNFKTLSRNDTRRAFEKVSDHLNISFNNASVYSIDFGRNIVLQHPEELYYNHFGHARHYNRLEQPNGLYYSNNIRVLAFYGKVKEQKQKGEIVPEIYQNKNLLRYEIRMRKVLNRQLNSSKIIVKNLWLEDFYHMLVQRWKNEYKKIYKVNNKLMRLKPTGSVKDFQRQITAMHINENGFDKYLKLIKEWQLKRLITKKQANDQRKFITGLMKVRSHEAGNELLTELDKKIIEAARQY